MPKTPPADTSAPVLTVDRTSDDSQSLEDADASVTIASLNTDVLLHLLSYCEPHDICRLSRACTWANEFVKFNIDHLPRISVKLCVKIADELSTYFVWNATGMTVLLSLTSKTFDMSFFYSRMTYAVVLWNEFVFSKASVPYIHSVIDKLSYLSLDQVKLTCAVHHNVFMVTTRDMAKLRELANMPFGTLVNDTLRNESDENIHYLLVAAFQTSLDVYLAIEAPRTLEHCYLLYFKALRALVNKPAALHPCCIRFNVLYDPKCGLHPSHQLRSVVPRVLDACQLSSLFQMRIDRLEPGCLQLKPALGDYSVTVQQCSIRLYREGIDDP